MDERGRFSVAARMRSFGDAFRGVRDTVRSEHNAWIHGAATLLVCALAGWLGVSRLEWAALVLAMAVVWAAETMNSALEHLADATSADRDPRIGRAKDAAAGAVLLAAVGAAIVGLLVLGPPLWARLG
jgi:diacylglycerol kinase (ATP)